MIKSASLPVICLVLQKNYPLVSLSYQINTFNNSNQKHFHAFSPFSTSLRERYRTLPPSSSSLVNYIVTFQNNIFFHVLFHRYVLLSPEFSGMIRFGCPICLVRSFSKTTWLIELNFLSIPLTRMGKSVGSCLVLELSGDVWLFKRLGSVFSKPEA